MLNITFGNRLVRDAMDVQQALAHLGSPTPSGFDRANSFSSSCGREPARGWLFMDRRDLDAVFRNSLHALTFTLYDATTNTTQAITWHNLVIATEPINLTPSHVADDPASVYLVEIADSRWRVAGATFAQSANAMYNVSSNGNGSGPTTYLDDSQKTGAITDATDATPIVVTSAAHGLLTGASVTITGVLGNAAANATWTITVIDADTFSLTGSVGDGTYTSGGAWTSPWTWATMAGDLWALMATQLGAYPGLPVTPHGTPAGWLFQGVPAWDALCDVLDRIGCTVRPDLTRTTAQYTIVQVGAADAASDAILAVAIAANRKIHDAEALPVVRGKVPYGVRVHFHKASEEPTQIPPWLQSSGPYTVDVAGPDSASAEPGIYHPIWDDLLAVYDGAGALTNTAALAARAAERSADYYRLLRSIGGGRFWKRFTGLLSLAPGSTVKTVTWSATAAGVVTDVVRRFDPEERARDYASAGTVQDLVRLGMPSGVDVVVQLVTGTLVNGKYDCKVQPRDNPNEEWDDAAPAWAIDLAGAASLTEDDRYNGTYSGLEVGGPYLISIAAANTGNPLSDDTKWLPVVGSIIPAAWDADTDYVTGNLVTDSGSTWLALEDSTGDQPPSANWLEVVLGDRGGYDSATVYSIGEYVQEVRALYAVRSGDGDSPADSVHLWANCTISGGVVTVEDHEQIPFVVSIGNGKIVASMDYDFGTENHYVPTAIYDSSSGAVDRFNWVKSESSGTVFTMQTESQTDPATAFGLVIHGRYGEDPDTPCPDDPDPCCTGEPGTMGDLCIKTTGGIAFWPFISDTDGDDLRILNGVTVSMERVSEDGFASQWAGSITVDDVEISVTVSCDAYDYESNCAKNVYVGILAAFPSGRIYGFSSSILGGFVGIGSVVGSLSCNEGVATASGTQEFMAMEYNFPPVGAYGLGELLHVAPDCLLPFPSPTAPTVDYNDDDVCLDADQITITGTGLETATEVALFPSVFLNNTIIFRSATQLVIQINPVYPLSVGALTARVNGGAANWNDATVQVATVIDCTLDDPTITESTDDICQDAATFTITGTNFDDSDPANNTVTLNLGASGTVTAATTTELTVTFDVNPTSLGSLTAIVDTPDGTSAEVQVATVIDCTPTITFDDDDLCQDALTFTIAGTNFDDSDPANNTVTLNLGAEGTVTAATTTELTVTFDTNPTSLGALTAVVDTPAGTSSEVQVATVVDCDICDCADEAPDDILMTVSMPDCPCLGGDVQCTLTRSGDTWTGTLDTPGCSTTSYAVTFSCDAGSWNLFIGAAGVGGFEISSCDPWGGTFGPLGNTGMLSDSCGLVEITITLEPAP